MIIQNVILFWKNNWWLLQPIVYDPKIPHTWCWNRVENKLPFISLGETPGDYMRLKYSGS